MADRRPVEDLGPSSEGDEARYDLAKQILRTLIAAYTTRITEADDETAPRLHAAQIRYGRQLSVLEPHDVERLNKIVNEYPALIEQVRAGGNP